MTDTVVFRCNVSATVGIGHLMRCREMARRLVARGIDAVILGPPENLKTDEDAALFVRWIPVETRGSSAEDAARVIALCRQMGARHLVMDDYRADPEYQQLLRSAGLRWLQQFDASKPWDFYADLVVNSSPYERHEHYLPYLRNPETRTLFGPRYGVLRPAFSKLVPRPDGRPVRRILVAFGGGDDRGALSWAISALAGKLGDGVSLVVMSGRGNPRREEVAALAAARPPGQVEFLVDPANVPELMAGCDLAVIGGGTMSYEAAICGLPMVFVALAPNQERPCMGWQDLTGAPLLGHVGQVPDTLLHRTVCDIMQDDVRRRDMAKKGRALVDGKGAERLVDALLERELK